MATTALMARDPARQRSDKGAALVLGGGAAALLLLWWREHGHGSGACGPKTGPAANLPTGLYISYFDAAKTVGTVWYVIQGVGRYGIPSPSALTRCFGPNPPITDISTVVGGFGNADDGSNSYVTTLGDISACTSCPPGIPG